MPVSVPSCMPLTTQTGPVDPLELELPDELLEMPDELLEMPDALLEMPDELLEMPDELLVATDALPVMPEELLEATVAPELAVETLEADDECAVEPELPALVAVLLTVVAAALPVEDEPLAPVLPQPPANREKPTASQADTRTMTSKEWRRS